MNEPYILYGSYASYYTAKTRAYLRKKAIPFVERLPSDPLFRNKVRPASNSHRIPQLLTPQGQVIQDSVDILDALEPLFPQHPAFPDTPKQRLFVHLMELLGSEGLLQLAWQHRWLFEENHDFVKMDFGRSFRPRGSNEELRHYGDLIAARMMGYGLPPTSESIRRDLDNQYISLLQKFESHLIDHPYLLGGHPSAADYALMGAFHAHLGRDPAGLRLMQHHAPRVVRWVENMLLPEVQAPEFFDTPIVYPADDEVPLTALALITHVGESYGLPFILDNLAFRVHVNFAKPERGEPIDREKDQPLLPPLAVEHNGETIRHVANLHNVWIAQRAQRFYSSLNTTAQSAIKSMLGEGLLFRLASFPVPATLERRNNRLFVV